MGKIKRFFVIDVMAMAYRSFFALGASQLSRKDGFPTGAIYGTAVFLNRLFTEEHPDYIAFVTDVPGKTFRHKIFKEYKANRDEAPEDLKEQIPFIFDLIKTYGYEPIKKKGFEADDLIGTIAKKHASDKTHIYIVSGDKDFYQLISDNIFLYAPKRNDRIEIIDVAGVYEKFRCKPEQVVDALALIGDSADNVPGVKGIGEKGAGELIESYGSLEGIYENLEKITAKRQKNGLEAYKKEAFLSKTLVTIDTKAPMNSRLSQYNCDGEKAAFNLDVLEFYRAMEFRTLARKVEAALSPSGYSNSQEVKSTKASKPTTVKKVSESQFSDFISSLQPGAPVSIFPKFEGSEVQSKKLIGLTVGQLRRHVYFDLMGEGEDRFIKMQYVSALLGDKTYTKVGHGLKQLVHALLNEDITLIQPYLDLKIVDYLLYPNDNRHQLEEISDRYLGVNQVIEQETEILLELYKIMYKELKQKQMIQVLDTIEMPLLDVLSRMEHKGVLVNAHYLSEYAKDLGKKIKAIEKKVFKEAGTEFNINSPKQLGDLLFSQLKIHQELGITKIKKTKTGYSTDESVLKSLAEHPLPKLVLEYRLLTKLKNTWLDSLPGHIATDSGRVHTSYRQTVAATGRLSSDKPNLQNIPMRSQEGRLIRKAFVAAKGYKLISADYSQVEIRLLAGMANEDHLIKAFKNGDDIHSATAAKIFGIPLNKVDLELRSRAKAVNFGIIYGMGPQRLAQETGVSLTEAKEFIKKYFEAYPGIKSFTEGLIEKARSLGYTTTITGRRRPIPGLGDGNRAIVARAENIAVNSPIQGSAADLIKLAMIRIDSNIKKARLRANIIMQVHDELVIECHNNDIEDTMRIVKDGMEGAITFPVPLLVELGSGKSWFDAH